MPRILPFAVLLLMTSPAAALVQAADGDWQCTLGGKDLGGLNIDGESYRFTDPEGRKHGGDLAAELDEVTYGVVSGILTETHEVTQLVFDDLDGTQHLTLETGDLAALKPIGACLRPPA